MAAAPEVQPQAAAAKPRTQRWVSVALLIGAAIDVAWVVFLLQFMKEPSATGRSATVLVLWFGFAGAAAFLAALAAAMLLFGGERSGRVIAWMAAGLMTVTCIAAVAGIPVLIALGSSRRSARN
jgi:NhaP-type Na+/H+ or K+/H+ antiporter